jgi:hypothetical protein
LVALAGGGTVMFACSGTITLTNTITISADTTIDGSGQSVSISGNDTVRVFTVNPGVTLNLNRLTIANGRVRGDNGGGIYSSAGSTLAVSDCMFSFNSTTPLPGIYTDAGGAIANRGTLAVSDSSFYGNTAYGSGGAIDNHSTLVVGHSTFYNNTTGGNGGGISNYGALTVSNSSFFNNSANGGGGAIHLSGYTANISDSTFYSNTAHEGGALSNYYTLTVSNSTFFGNGDGATYRGGGIYNDYPGVAIVANSTFSGNSAGYEVGGIFNNSSLSSVTLKNTIIANSTFWPGGNCYGSIIDGGGNLSFPDTTCPGINADPMLGPLQDNGGPTWTMALGEGSAAIDAADDAICAAPPVNNLDQRGFVRPWGAHCDIGAVEQIQEPVAVRLSTINAGSTPGAVAPTAVAGLLLLALGGCAAWGRRQTQQVG